MLDPVVEAVRGLHPAKVWEDVSCRLYTTFWVLSTYDLYVPTGRYDEEIGRAKQAIKDLDSSSDMVRVFCVQCMCIQSDELLFMYYGKRYTKLFVHMTAN